MTEARVVTWHRDNVVKNAVSYVKARCKSPVFANHIKDPSDSANARMLALAPRTLLRLALLHHSYRKRLLEAELFLQRIVSFDAHYEDAQVDPERVLRGMLGGLPAKASNRVAPTTKKSAPEDLSHLLLDFDVINASFTGARCLQRMLLSAEARRWDLCSGVVQPNNTGVSLRTALDRDIAEIAPNSSTEVVLCTTTSHTNDLDSAQTRLCKRARRQHFLKTGVLEPVEVCVVGEDV